MHFLIILKMSLKCVSECLWSSRKPLSKPVLTKISDVRFLWNWTYSQIPPCTCSISHNAPFSAHFCSEQCIVGYGTGTEPATSHYLNQWWPSLVTPIWPRFNIKMSSYQYRKSHCGDKTVVRSSYLYNGISYTGKMSSLYWIGAQATMS